MGNDSISNLPALWIWKPNNGPYGPSMLWNCHIWWLPNNSRVWRYLQDLATIFPCGCEHQKQLLLLLIPFTAFHPNSSCNSSNNIRAEMFIQKFQAIKKFFATIFFCYSCLNVCRFKIAFFLFKKVIIQYVVII
jgi:hypothetical protein